MPAIGLTHGPVRVAQAQYTAYKQPLPTSQRLLSPLSPRFTRKYFLNKSSQCIIRTSSGSEIGSFLSASDLSNHWNLAELKEIRK